MAGIRWHRATPQEIEKINQGRYMVISFSGAKEITGCKSYEAVSYNSRYYLPTDIAVEYKRDMGKL